MVDEESAGGGARRGVSYDLLLAEAVPEIYRHNAFRVTQLPVNATQREISRQVDKIRMAEKIGVAAEATGGLLPLATAPDSDALRGALQRLRDPEKRLIDELLWFWPLDDGVAGDAALKALETEGTGAASRLWQSAVDEGGRRGAIALHNLAILAHAVVLDAELDEQAGKLSDSRRQALEALWSTALKHWGELRKNELFAEALRERVREIDDPRLDESTVANIHRTLAEALASVSARLAVADFDAGQTDACRRVLSKLWDSGLPQADVKRAVREALGPVRARLRASGESFEKKPDGAPREVLVAAGRFLEQTERLLLLVDMALPEGDATRTGLHDDVAMTVMGITVAYVNESDDFRGSLPWLERAAKIAEGEAALDRIAENTDTARENADAEDAYDAHRSGRVPVSTPRLLPQKKRSGCVTCGGIVAAIFGVLLVIGLIGQACEGSDTSSSSSGSTSGQAGSVEPPTDTQAPTPSSSSGKPAAGYQERNDLAQLFKRVWAVHSATPKTLSKPYPELATRLKRLARQIRSWTSTYQTSWGTRRVALEGARFASATGAWYADPFSNSKFKAYKRSFDDFRQHVVKWSP